MKVIFMGTPNFSVPVLDRLCNTGHELICVYTQPPRPCGRGKREQRSPVHKYADGLGLEVRHPISLKTAEVQQAFASLNADVAVVVAYGLLLPRAVLDLPRFGCLNVHASLLPRWRGAAPIHRAIMEGDKTTGISIMKMEVGLDTGPVLLREETAIGISETTADLHNRLSDIGAELIVKTLGKVESIDAVPQPYNGITYAAKVEKSEALIDFAKPAETVDRKIRALSPFPGAWSEFKGMRLKFLCSEVCRKIGSFGAPGKVISDTLEVACQTGSVRITRIQKAGKAAQIPEDFLRGVKIKRGDIFG